MTGNEFITGHATVADAERARWGGPSPWAGRDSRTPAQKRADDEAVETVVQAIVNLRGIGAERDDETEHWARVILRALGYQVETFAQARDRRIGRRS